MRVPSSQTARYAWKGIVLTSLLATAGSVGGGCISRPVEACDPSTKTSFSTSVKQTAIDKVDVLFAIDNSQSMGDKQTLLAQAVPDLLNRLLQPQCVDADGKAVGQSTLDASGEAICGADSKPEFPAVHDLHIGIISSALGGVGAATTCVATEKVGANKRIDAELNRHNDDSAHLLNRAGDEEKPVADISASDYLYYLPSKNKKNEGKTPKSGEVQIEDGAKLEASFKEMITGVHEYGCGYEAQLESVYRFLIQPDPYASIKVDGSVAKFEGVDDTILQQRSDFLRDDSLVAVIMLTDENESTVDPRSLGGQGWRYADSAKAARPTAACATDPNSAECGTCRIRSFFDADQACKSSSGGLALLSDEEDGSNVRFARMKERFGIDPKYPIERYINGFTQTLVPNRDEEHPLNGDQYEEYHKAGGSCVNPLFAASPLPTKSDQELCALTLGLRTPDQVFFALIGGLPWQILTQGVGDDLTTVKSDAPYKDRLDSSDWTRILGASPATYDETGQNIFMKESIKPRSGITEGNSVNTREWDTKNNDLQYACTFDLPADLARDCPNVEDQACACGGNNGESSATDTPLCDATTPTKQVRAKAYPTLQELRLVSALDTQGIVASICPRELTNKDSDNYGYRPAVKAIIDRLRNALNNQCLPQKLLGDEATQEEKDAIPCLVLAQLKEPGTSADCTAKGLEIPSDKVLEKFHQDQIAKVGVEAAKSQEDLPVCLLPQIKESQFAGAPTCEGTDIAGWCYLTKAAAGSAIGTCNQAIKFSSASQTATIGAAISLQCIEKAPLLVNPDDPRTTDTTKNLDCTAK